MNRKQLQEWLEQFPEDTEVLVVVEKDLDNGYVGVIYDDELFTGDESQFNYTDLTGEKGIRSDDPQYDKKYLLLGMF